mgnify:CR=1 FL=1
MALFIFSTQIVGMTYPLFLAYCQGKLDLMEPLDHPRLFGVFLTCATCIPSLLSIPCFYISGCRYVEYKKKEEAFIEAAESFKDKDIYKIKGIHINSDGHNTPNNEMVGGIKRVSSSMKLYKSKKGGDLDIRKKKLVLYRKMNI